METVRMLTVACAVAVAPPAPVAVAVYVVLAVGTITVEPDRARPAGSSVGIAGEIATEVAFALCHVSVAVCPPATTGGEIARVIVGVEVAATTVTVRDDEAECPEESVAVAV
jgi:hypothetical protein